MSKILTALTALSTEENNLESLSGSTRIVVGASPADLQKIIKEMLPYILVVDAYYGSDRGLITFFRETIPWGYVVLFYQRQSDLQLMPLVDEICPLFAITEAQFALLLRLADLNKLRFDLKEQDGVMRIKHDIFSLFGANLDRFILENGRFISPGNWGRKVKGRWRFFVAQICRLVGVQDIWEEAAATEYCCSAANAEIKPLLCAVGAVAEASEGMELRKLGGGGSWLLFFRCEGAAFPLATFSKICTAAVAEPPEPYLLSANHPQAEILEGVQSIFQLFSTAIKDEYVSAMRAYRDGVYFKEVFLVLMRLRLPDDAPSGVIFFDDEMQITWATEKANRLLATKGRSLRENILFLPELVDSIVQALSEGSIQQNFLSLENGGEVHATILPMGVEKGQGQNCVVLVREAASTVGISPADASRERFLQLGELAASMAHEIRNPLTSVYGFMQLLRMRLQGTVEDDNLRFADYILQELDRANHILTNYLNVAKPKPEDLDKVNVNDLLSKMLRLTKSQALLKGVELTWDLAAELPAVEAKEEPLVQMFLNLVNNALQATPKGGRVDISTSCVGNNVQVLIQDTGCGIHPSIAEHIFAPFFSTKEGGTGLGLSLCRQVARKHGGDIRFTSTVGEGSTFVVLLPL